MGLFGAMKDLVGGGIHELGEAFNYMDHRGQKKEKAEEQQQDQGADERNKQQVGAALETHDPVAMEGATQGVGRTMDMDAAQVQLEMSRLPDKVFHMMKQAALANPKVAGTIKPAIKRKFYGSEVHKKYGAYIEFLTGGRITAEEAMRMNPTGGIAGPGLKGIAFDSGPLHEHAIRHDATGFLITAFDIGPGYGGKDGKNMLNGQVEGIARELVVGKSQLPSTEAVGAPSQETKVKTE